MTGFFDRLKDEDSVGSELGDERPSYEEPETTESLPDNESSPSSNEVQESVATITLNRPESLNAMTNGLMKDLVDTLARVEADKSVRVVVITGSVVVSVPALNMPDRQAPNRLIQTLPAKLTPTSTVLCGRFIILLCQPSRVSTVRPPVAGSVWRLHAIIQLQQKMRFFIHFLKFNKSLIE